MNQFDLFQAEHDRDQGIRSVGVNSGVFVPALRSVARAISEDKGQVSSDELRAWAARHQIRPHTSHAWGAIFRGKQWQCIGRKKSSFVSNHGRQIHVWRYTA